ncbi:MAG TPA: CHAT domain-containing protein [Thermoanaerobaculia bacterium]|nr:CHAT domain-containing protein [Thermoanaerobaculia bacterium]
MKECFDIFLSYTATDRPSVRRLALALRARGIRVWFDQWESPPGSRWQERLEETIETIGAAAVLVGKEGRGPWQDLVSWVYLNRFVVEGRRVIPILLPKAPSNPSLPLFLAEFEWFDLRRGLTEAALERLVWGITGRYRHSARPAGRHCALGDDSHCRQAPTTTAMNTYSDFSIKIEPKSGGEYPLLVLASPAGQGRGVLPAPFSFRELGATLNDLGLAVRRSAKEPLLYSRELSSAGLASTLSPRVVGERLFHAIFPEPVLRLFDRSLGMLEGRTEEEGKQGEQAGLRLALHLAPEHPDLAFFASLPWELLYWLERREFLCLGRKTSLVRHLDVPLPSHPLSVAGPLRILVAAACPNGLPPLNLEDERQRIEESWASLGGVTTEFLEHTSAPTLRVRLREKPFHVLHFMGHGCFESKTGVGALLFEGDNGGRVSLPGSVLGELLRDFPSLRLVFLNACDTARSSSNDGIDPFAGVAAALVMAGLPAVVAMQFQISDGAAIAFSQAFYEHLSTGALVEAAIGEGRMAIRLRDPSSLEWATPVLFMRGTSGALFNLSE